MAPTFSTKPTIRQDTDGTTLIFHCSIVADPKPTISWFRNGVKVQDSDKFQVRHDQTFGSSFLLNLTFVPFSCRWLPRRRTPTPSTAHFCCVVWLSRTRENTKSQPEMTSESPTLPSASTSTVSWLIFIGSDLISVRYFRLKRLNWKEERSCYGATIE